MSETGLAERKDLPEAATWKLEDIYPHEDEWERAFSKVQGDLAPLASYKDQLTSAAALKDFLSQRDAFEEEIYRLFSYAMLRRDEDTRVAENQARFNRLADFETRAQSALSFFSPWLVAHEKEVDGWLQQEPALAAYRRHLDQILRLAPHIRSGEVEEVLSAAHGPARGPSDTYDMLTDADLEFPSVTDSEGERYTLTKERYYSLIRNPDRTLRKNAFEAMHGTYARFRNTFAASLASEIRFAEFFARARRYPSSLAQALNDTEIPTDVYDNLVATVERRVGSLHRYLDLKRTQLGLDKLHVYDMYVPLAKTPPINYTFEEASKLVIDAMAPLGQEYQEILKAALTSRWVDHRENRGKAGGAYSLGVFGAHPYVLMSFQGTLNDVFTLAHELGHSLHSHFTSQTQPFVYAHYTIFVAEVASTLNEALLTEHLLRTSTDEALRRHILFQHLEHLRTTLFRQTMFAAFERRAHELLSSGKAVTADSLDELYHEACTLHYGPQTALDHLTDVEWARIPHFYRSFYVYQYATGVSAATALSKRILEEGAPAAKDYLHFLSSGNTKPPIDLLKGAGVDMTEPAPIEAAIDVFDQQLQRLTDLL